MMNKLACFVLLLILGLVIAETVNVHSDVGPSSIKTTKESECILIKGGTVVNADRSVVSDVLVIGGTIDRVAEGIEVSSPCRVINAKGKYVMPGGIDPHVHLALPFMGTISMDDHYTGTAAALAGGTTLLMDFVIPTKGKSLLEAYDEWRAKAERAAGDYAFHFAIVEWNEQVGKEMEILVKEKGINSFKAFMAYKGALMVTDSELYNIFKKAKETGSISMVHAENGDLVYEGQKKMKELGIHGPEGHGLSRPAIVEAEAVSRAAVIADRANAPLYIVHVMSKEAMNEVAKARNRGQRVIGEPIVAGLTLDDSYTYNENWDYAAQYVMSPPLRPREEGHKEALLNGLKSGILSVVGTDHCVFNHTQKSMGRNDFTMIPNGLNGVEERMIVLWTIAVATGKLTPSEYVRVTSTEAARIFNIYPRKGVIAAGSDADIIILNPDGSRTVSAKTHHQNIDYNVFEGFVTKGLIETTIANGVVVFDNGVLKAQRGAGRFIPTPPFSPVLFDNLETEVQHKTPRPVKRS